MNTRINIEELCKARFTACLLTLSPSPSVSWQKVPQSSEPPDYYASIGGDRFAVEVTRIMEKLTVGSQSLPQATIVASLWSFVEEIEQAAEEQGCLSGTYVVGFLYAINEFSSVRQQLREDLLHYIRCTQTVSRAPEEVMLRRPGLEKCWIQKVHDLDSKVLVGGPTNVKWEGEAALEICTLLQEILDNKRHKLRNIPGPKILLLYDSYGFADPVMYRDCLPKLTGLGQFHSVFVVRNEDAGFFLHSEEKGWLHSS